MAVMGAAPGPPSPGWNPWYQTRVSNNLQPMGILWCVYGAYRLVGGVVGALVLRSLAGSGVFNEAPPFVAHLVGSMVPVMLLWSALMGVASIVTGYHLLTRQPWARTLAIVMGILALIKPITGTALGVYTLWVLAPSASGLEWQSLQNTRPGATDVNWKDGISHHPDAAFAPDRTFAITGSGDASPARGVDLPALSGSRRRNSQAHRVDCRDASTFRLTKP